MKRTRSLRSVLLLAGTCIGLSACYYPYGYGPAYAGPSYYGSGYYGPGYYGGPAVDIGVGGRWGGGWGHGWHHDER